MSCGPEQKRIEVHYWLTGLSASRMYLVQAWVITVVHLWALHVQ